ncbi:MAG: cysteine--tRNA ligase [Thermoplasmata archaeon]|nr:cysteine--tRNA ligase [Thermoplasmata archaeon]
MALRMYNTLSGRVEEFRPLVGNRVYMFVCGPTVYDHSHIGHARTYISFDVIAKYLAYRGYSVFYLMNVTDIDDKMIQRANEVGIPVEDLADMYFKSFLEDMRALGVDSVNLYAKATEHVPEILEQIEALMEKGIAYESGGSVYFEVKKFPSFGKLSRQRLDKLEAGARVDVREEKRNPEDFALWKAYKPGEPSWDSPWGPGRPGWHVEDTAITMRYFGSQYDIHGGGRDLIFPHHDSEIAIAESITGKEPFVRYWLHTGFLNVEGEKMSKSLGNVITIKELLKRFRPEVVRFFFLHSHYRSPVDFTLTLLEEAEAAYERLENTVSNLRRSVKEASGGVGETGGTGGGGEMERESGPGLGEKALETRRRFVEAMDEDFNTREALAALFDLAREANRALAEGGCTPEEVKEALSVFEDYGGILGLFGTPADTSAAAAEAVIRILLEEREAARRKKDWETADRIRERLAEAGITVEDGKDGPRWRFSGV